jgi:hypothetical protein
MGGRNTPSPGLEKAADYIENHFKSLGLFPGNNGSFRQPYSLYKDSVISTSLKVNGKDFLVNNDFQPNTQMNYTAEMRFSEAVFAGYGIAEADRDDYKGMNVTGKLVILSEGMPEGYQSAATGLISPSFSFGKIMTAQKKGAAAILVISKNFPGRGMNIISSWGMNSYKAAQNPLVFSVSENIISAIMGDDAKELADKMKNNLLSAKIYKAEIDLGYFKQIKTTQAANILGLLEGTDKKDEYVVITAHYDHIGTRADTIINYGADDDGSGTVTILELAEAFAKAKAAGKGPPPQYFIYDGKRRGTWTLGFCLLCQSPCLSIRKNIGESEYRYDWTDRL